MVSFMVICQFELTTADGTASFANVAEEIAKPLRNAVMVDLVSPLHSFGAETTSGTTAAGHSRYVHGVAQIAPAAQRVGGELRLSCNR